MSINELLLSSISIYLYLFSKQNSILYKKNSIYPEYFFENLSCTQKIIFLILKIKFKIL